MINLNDRAVQPLRDEPATPATLQSIHAPASSHPLGPLERVRHVAAFPSSSPSRTVYLGCRQKTRQQHSQKSTKDKYRTQTEQPLIVFGLRPLPTMAHVCSTQHHGNGRWSVLLLYYSNAVPAITLPTARLRQKSDVEPNKRHRIRKDPLPSNPPSPPASAVRRVHHFWSRKLSLLGFCQNTNRGDDTTRKRHEDQQKSRDGK